ncbi:hypothetical protein AQUCO_01100345v1 [Aquilegia coerulea]|uniref:RING-type domain-containing protein n=2 Tax=Aquilegia coerulea TaxID=218851 RepID=A0A2G5E6S2_AQUCA|nr:hypothetical protein AQUCO_01100345v1 [Aquilegia coerulea]
MWQKQPIKSSYRESIKALEADIQYANTLAAALPRDYGGECLQMRLSYSPFAPFFLLLIEWMECSCTDTLPNYLGLHHILIYKIHVDGMTTISSHERRATLREFYAVIFPYLQQLQGDVTEFKDSYKRNWCTEVNDRIAVEEKKFSHKDLDREDECGICMETCTKMVLPNCGHSMCIDCFRDWNLRSQSCPFCRGNLKRVNSDDLWVLTSDGDVVDRATLAQENLRRFYLYVNCLPLVNVDTLFFIHDYMI